MTTETRKHYSRTIAGDDTLTAQVIYDNRPDSHTYLMISSLNGVLEVLLAPEDVRALNRMLCEAEYSTPAPF
ncbi:hypothetical protein P3T27_002095 [Kitasatospora sp. MAA19]|uniref:hypothetical protein n=1 Tax=unclassified Kitasatospora TaxID=2633591 RepID=UPI00247364C8|nr:hypothetical protein [Kitasatospora sp. MAA19]MDH6705385.1 hypothetical protein [Kitasatospora sp. MAA19]